MAGPVLERINLALEERSMSHEAHVALSREEEAFFEQIPPDRLFTYVYGSGSNRWSDCLRYEGREREHRARMSVTAADQSGQTTRSLKGSQTAELRNGCEPNARKALLDGEASRAPKVAENRKP